MAQIASKVPAFEPEEEHCEPDHAKARELGAGEGLVVHEDAQQELDRRRDVLEDADHGQRDAVRGGREHDQRGRGDHARAYKQQVRACSRMQECARAGVFTPAKPD